MKQIFLFITLFFISVAAGLFLKNDPGVFYVAIHHWTIQTTLWLAILIIIFCFILLHGFLLLIRNLKNLSHVLQQKKRNRQLILAVKLLSTSQITPTPWRKMIALIPKIKHEKLLDEGTLTALQKNAWHGALQACLKSNEPQEFEALMKIIPSSLQEDEEIFILYIRYLLQYSSEKLAELKLRKYLKHQFSEGLIALYGHIPQSYARLDWAESLCTHHPLSANLYYCLGMLCVQNQLWGKAKRYFEESLRLHSCVKTYFALANLYEHLQDKDSACATYKKAFHEHERTIMT